MQAERRGLYVSTKSQLRCKVYTTFALLLFTGRKQDDDIRPCLYRTDGYDSSVYALTSSRRIILYLRSALFQDITQHKVVNPYRRFRTAYLSHLHGCPETSVRNYRSSLHNFPEQRKFHVHCGGSLFYVFSILNTSQE